MVNVFVANLQFTDWIRRGSVAIRLGAIRPCIIWRNDPRPSHLSLLLLVWIIAVDTHTMFFFLVVMLLLWVVGEVRLFGHCILLSLF